MIKQIEQSGKPIVIYRRSGVIIDCQGEKEKFQKPACDAGGKNKRRVVARAISCRSLARSRIVSHARHARVRRQRPYIYLTLPSLYQPTSSAGGEMQIRMRSSSTSWEYHRSLYHPHYLLIFDLFPIHLFTSSSPCKRPCTLSSTLLYKFYRRPSLPYTLLLFSLPRNLLASR